MSGTNSPQYMRGFLRGWRHQRRAKMLCRECPNAVWNGGTRCEACRVIHAAREKERARVKREAMKAMVSQ